MRPSIKQYLMKGYVDNEVVRIRSEITKFLLETPKIEYKMNGL